MSHLLGADRVDRAVGWDRPFAADPALSPRGRAAGGDGPSYCRPGSREDHPVTTPSPIGRSAQAPIVPVPPSPGPPSIAASRRRSRAVSPATIAASGSAAVSLAVSGPPG